MSGLINVALQERLYLIRRMILQLIDRACQHSANFKIKVLLGIRSLVGCSSNSILVLGRRD